MSSIGENCLSCHCGTINNRKSRSVCKKNATFKVVESPVFNIIEEWHPRKNQGISLDQSFTSFFQTKSLIAIKVVYT